MVGAGKLHTVNEIKHISKCKHIKHAKTTRHNTPLIRVTGVKGMLETITRISQSNLVQRSAYISGESFWKLQTGLAVVTATGS